MNFILIGNGFDLALGKKSNLLDFVDYIKENPNKLLKEKIINKTNFKSVNSFIENYEGWCKKNNTAGFDNNWSNFEFNIDFFFSYVINNNYKYSRTSFATLKKGYIFFSYLMQYYYFNILERKNSQKHFLDKLNIFNNFLLGLQQYELLSLNYTNYTNFSLNVENKPEINYIHFITPGISFWKAWNSISSYKKSNNSSEFVTMGSSNYLDGVIDLNNPEFDDFRKKTTKPLTYYQYYPFKKNKEGLTPKPTNHFLQLLILGSQKNDLHSDLEFLSKNDNDNLFILNYPKFILNKFEAKLSFKNDTLYIFGYSFGLADVNINNFILKVINNNSSIKFLFFNEDIEKNPKLISDMIENFNALLNEKISYKIDKDDILKLY